MLEEKIAADFKEAMKARNQLRTQALSFLRSELKNVAIDKKTEKLEDSDVAVVLKKLIKQRQDSIVQFEKGQRMDLVQKEKKELELLKSYMPPELSSDEVCRLVAEAIVLTGAASMKDMGKVMKEVMDKTKGQADNKMVSDCVRKSLEAKT